MRKAGKIVTGIMTVMLQMPIWYYIWYSILKAINPDRLIWFLFWIYVPLTFLLAIFNVVLDKAFD